jgi:hypothetical protein
MSAGVSLEGCRGCERGSRVNNAMHPELLKGTEQRTRDGLPRRRVAET